MLACVRQEVASARMDWQAAIDTMEMDHWHVAVGRFYYAAFHAATALLLAKTRKRAKTHQWLHRMAGKLSKQFSDELGGAPLTGLGKLMDMRHQAEYLAPPATTQAHALSAQSLAAPSSTPA